MSRDAGTNLRAGAVAGPRVVWGWRFAPAILAQALAAIALAFAAVAQPHSDHDLETEQARVDSLNRAVLWDQVVPLATGARIVDVAFAAVGRNIVTPVEIAWALADSAPELIAAAARPIAGTADPGEELGRRGAGILRRPIALHTTSAGSWVLERDGRLVSMRGTQVDSVRLDLGGRAPGDLAVSDAGLVHVLTDTEVRVWPQAAEGPPLWTMTLPRDLVPARALAVSARGEIYVVGDGKTTIAVFDLGRDGKYAVARSATAPRSGLRKPRGVTLLEAMLLPVPGREGWVPEDRYLAVSEAGGGVAVLDATTLRPVGRVDLGADLPGLSPGRIDINNRGQITVVEAAGGRAWAFPTRLLATAMSEAPIRWRRIGRTAADSTAAADTGGTGP